MTATDLRIEKTGYGTYLLSGFYRGVAVEHTTHNSMLYDWLNDPSNEEKHHEANEIAKMIIEEAYFNSYATEED